MPRTPSMTSEDKDEIDITLETNQTFDVNGVTMRLTRPLTVTTYKEGRDVYVVGKNIGLMLAEHARTTKGAILKLIRMIVLEDCIDLQTRQEAVGYQKETFDAIEGLLVQANDHEV